MNPLSPWLLWHAYPALAAVLIGIVIMARPKGTASHRLAGRLWVALMVWVAAGSFLLTNQYSWIHGLSAWTLISLTIAVRAIRRGHVAVHRGHMMGCAVGLVVAGGFALFSPTRMAARLIGASIY